MLLIRIFLWPVLMSKITILNIFLLIWVSLYSHSFEKSKIFIKNIEDMLCQPKTRGLSTFIDTFPTLSLGIKKCLPLNCLP